jgi:hypothetical protein
MFRQLIDYESYIVHSKDSFYKDEQDTISKGFIISLKNNNFIDYLLDGAIPNHIFKSKSSKIVFPEQRLTIWNNEFTLNNMEAKCPIYKCENKITCKVGGFEYGVIKRNRELTANNMRPICKECRDKMGTKDWIVYDTELKSE